MQIRKTNRDYASSNFTLPSPVGGLNCRDSLDLMAATDAIVMDNYFPGETKVSLRRGYVKYVGLPFATKTLLEYKSPTENRLLACSGGNVYDISSSSAVKIYEREFYRSYWQSCLFKNRLFMVNGIDEPQVFYVDETGDHFEAVSFNGDGLEVKNLVNVCVSKQRLFFAEKGSLNVWYSEEAGEVQGNLLKFDLSAIARCGGDIRAIACWTQDGGQGMDDLTVFITSEGEAIVYSGNDPSNYEDWTLKGVYRLSKPIGYQCILPYQGDVVIISEDGYIPLSKALPLDKAGGSQVAFSDKIRSLVLERTRVNRYKDGWQGIIYSRGGYAIFNVPTAQQFEQHVINLNTGAWCRFTNIRAYCWGMLDGRLYFGSDDGVFLFDEGYSDNQTPIMGHIEQAYSNLGSDNLKKIQLINPRTTASAKYALVVYTNMDFESKDKQYAENIGSSGVTKWNAVSWSSLASPNGTKWASLQGKIRSQWIANSATGFKASLVFKTKTRGNLIEWYDTGFRYEQGSGIL